VGIAFRDEASVGECHVVTVHEAASSRSLEDVSQVNHLVALESVQNLSEGFARIEGKRTP
jgi:hypothetical protein